MSTTLSADLTVPGARGELIEALEDGKIKCPKYRTLDINERTFVQHVVFGGLTPTQAIKLVRPGVVNPSSAGRRMASRHDVAEVMEELGVAKDQHWMQQLKNQKDMSLRKLAYIRDTSDDPALAAACADKIWGRANDEIKNAEKNKKEEGIDQVKFVIVAAPVPEHLNRGGVYNPKDIIEVEPEEVDQPVDSGLGFKLNYGDASKKNYGED